MITYHLVGKKFKNPVLLIFSLIFYMWGAPKFIILLLASLTINFYIVQYMNNHPARKKIPLILSVLINIGLLGYFKYANFFVDNVNTILAQLGFSTIQWMKIALPIGISFFTFQSMTYTIDVYRKVHQPLDKLQDYLLYILMFPQLIAGPIVRFNTVADDIIERSDNETKDAKLYGIFLFIIGLSKKVLVANILGKFVDQNFALSVSSLSTSELWITIIAYSFQIYFDFSGYSDMAIGLGRIIGFKFPENFNNPYISQNITEFWRRWHITLGEWMRDYLYIPLGGNRVKTSARLYLNLIIVFLLSGLWHGANWTFVIWGAWHGFFLILDRVFLIKLLKKVGRIPRIVFTYIVVIVGWVFFRAESLSDAVLFIKGMFSFQNLNQVQLGSKEFIIALLIALLIAFSNATKFGVKMQNWLYSEFKSKKDKTIFMVASILLFIICASYISASGFNPFIYFRF